MSRGGVHGSKVMWTGVDQCEECGQIGVEMGRMCVLRVVYCAQRVTLGPHLQQYIRRMCLADFTVASALPLDWDQYGEEVM